MNCIHYKVCVFMDSDTLCSDPLCSLNKKLHEKEEQARLSNIQEILSNHKKSLGVKHFSDLNKK